MSAIAPDHICTAPCRRWGGQRDNIIHNRMQGFYRVEDKARMGSFGAACHLEATGAREAYPCFDVVRIGPFISRKQTCALLCDATALDGALLEKGLCAPLRPLQLTYKISFEQNRSAYLFISTIISTFFLSAERNLIVFCSCCPIGNWGEIMIHSPSR